MSFLDTIIMYAEQSPYLSNDEIDINILFSEYPASPFKNITLRKIKNIIENLFSEMYFKWKDSKELDIISFFTKKTEEMSNRGDPEHAKAIMFLLRSRLEDPENSYLRSLEIEKLRDNMIIMCEKRSSMVYKIEWPMRNEDVQTFLNEFGWLKTDCSRNKNPMTRSRKPKALKKRRRLGEALFYWNPFYDMWATVDEDEKNIYLDSKC